MTKFKILRTCWGWSLFHEGDLCASADSPLALMMWVVYLQQQQDLMGRPVPVTFN